MTGKELVERILALPEKDQDRVFVIADRGGWSNIDRIEVPEPEVDSTVRLMMEEYPLFSQS